MPCAQLNTQKVATAEGVLRRELGACGSQEGWSSEQQAAAAAVQVAQAADRVGWLAIYR